MTGQQPREVSFPPGETTYREFFYRVHHSDGTVTDDVPERIGGADPNPIVALARRLAAPIADRSANVVRMERVVTVTTTEWAAVPKDTPLVDVEKLGQAVPQGDPNDYCQRQLCGHARGFHVKGTPDTGGGEHDGPCERCGATSKCAFFVPKVVYGVVEFAAREGELLLRAQDGAIDRRGTLGTPTHAGLAAESFAPGQRIRFIDGTWVKA